MHSTPVKHRICIILALLLAAGIFSFFHNTFSPGATLHGNGDQACFYMAGKALAHGYIPYVDFIDVKGPIVFFTYALGYALGGTNAIAIMFAGIHFLTLIAFYKTAKLYIENKGFCVLAAILPLLFFLCPAYHCYGRAEEILIPFVAYAIYFSLLCIKNQTDIRHLLKASCFLGICGAVAFLTKFNVSLPFFTLWLYLFIGAYRHNTRDAFICFSACAVGFLAIILPTLIYLLCTHSLEAFFDVYFLLNIETYKDFAQSCSLENKILSFFFRCVSAPLALLFLFICPFKTDDAWKVFSDRSLYLIVGVSLLFCCAGGWPYYYLIATPLYMLISIACIYPMQKVHMHFTPLQASILTPLLVIAFLSFTQDTERTLKNLFQHKDEKFAELDMVLNRYHQPKLLYLNFLDLGLGVDCDALPACAQWFHLNGSPEAFTEKQRSAIRSGIPDFVITTTSSDSKLRIQDRGEQDFSQPDWLKTHHYEPVVSQGGLTLYQKENGEIQRSE